MQFPFWAQIIVALLIAVGLGKLVNKIVERDSEEKSEVGRSVMIFGTIGLFFLFQWLVPDVVVITYANGKWYHSTKSVLFSMEAPDGTTMDLTMGESYIANFTDEFLILYPEYYGPSYKASSLKEKSPVMIEPRQMKFISDKPDYYFRSAPNTISTKSRDVVEKWVLEPYGTYY